MKLFFTHSTAPRHINIKLKPLAYFVWLLLANSATAQNGILTGTVRDDKTRTPLSGASVALFRTADSSLLNQTITNADGVFTIERLTNNNYFLLIQSMGYQTKKITDVKLAHVQKKDIGFITLLQSENVIQSVTVVSANKVPVKSFAEKQVYNASQFASAKGGTATDVLKNLPGISVNSLGEISVRGLTGFQLQLNGKPMRGDVEAILNVIAANNIENIELLTAPSAKYDADGKAGIINIVTKKGTADGLIFTANLQQGLPAVHQYNNHVLPLRFGGDVAINYQQRKWNIAASVNYLRNDAAGYREGDVNTAINDTFTFFPSSGERSFKRYTYAARAAITYNADKNNSFTVGAFASKKYQARTANLLYNVTKTDLLSNAVIQQSTYFNSNLQTKEANLYVGNFDYTHTFNNKSLLSASFLYEYDDLFGNTKNLNQYFPKTIDTLQYTYNTNTNPLYGYRALLSYAYKIGSLQLESGYQFRQDKQDGDFLYQTNIVGTKVFITDPAFTSGVLTINQIHAIYTQFNGEGKKLQYNAGLRYEYATRQLSFSNNAAAGNTLRLSNLFPSASVLYALENKWKIKSAYSRRIQRTTNYELNPFPEREHSETLEQGDANLLPEFTSLTELGIMKDYTGGTFFATLYYQQTKNQIQRVNSVYNDTVLNRIYTNAGTAKQWGLEVGSSFTPIKWCTIYLGANVYNYAINGALFNNAVAVDNSSLIYALKTNLDFVIAPTFSAQLNVSYLSKRATAQGEDGYFFTPNSSVKKTFLQERLSATLQWQNMDAGLNIFNRQRITTWGGNFYTTTNYIVETDVVLLNLSFNLKQSSRKIKLPSSEFGEKEF